MAGFKKTIKDMNPSWFITFDGDSHIYAPPVYVNPTIIDEMGNTEGIIHNEHPLYSGYGAGARSHIELEQDDQYAIRFGLNQKNEDAMAHGASRSPCSYIEVPCPDLNNYVVDDEFSFIWMMKRNNRPSDNNIHYDDMYHHPYNEGFNALYETVFRIGNILELSTELNYSSSTGYYKFFFDEHDNPSFTLNRRYSSSTSSDVPVNFGARPVVTSGIASFNVIRYKDGVFEHWIDGNLYAQIYLRNISGFDSLLHNVPYYAQKPLIGSSYPEMTTFIGGKPTNWIRTKYPRWQIICPTEFDQMALFPRYISNDEIMELYRRVWNRATMYSLESPRYHVPFSEKQSQITGNGSIKNIISPNYIPSPSIIGKYTDCLAEQEGMAYGDNSIQIAEGGLRFPNRNSYGNYADYFNFGNNFTLEFGFKGYATRRVSIFQTFQLNAKYQVSIFASSSDGYYRQGYIDFKFGDKQWTFQKDLLNFEWHKIVLRRSGNYLDFIIDEEWFLTQHLVDFGFNDEVATLFLTSQEDNTTFPAHLSELIIYPKPLSDIVLKAHMKYDNLYSVKGQVVQAGQPYEAIVRAYSRRYGNLLKETKSDLNTGNFYINISSNELVDLVLLPNIKDDGVRPRIIGAINPDVENSNVYTVP